MVQGGLGKILQFLADNIVERCFESEASLDRLDCFALLNPNLMRFPFSHCSFHIAQQFLDLSHSPSFDQRRRPETFRTAIAIAFFWPTSTTNRLPLVTPVYSRFRCSMA